MKIVRIKTEREKGFELDYSDGEGLVLSIVSVFGSFVLLGCLVQICIHFFG
jgi:hypothetical protein